MVRQVVLAVAIVGAVAQVFAATPAITLKVTSGKAMVWNKDIGGWRSVTDTATIAATDSVFVDHQEAVALQFGAESKVLVKGLARLALDGAELNMNVTLVEGQLFLSREKPYEYNAFAVTARGCKFTPVGTAGAVKLTRLGEPSVAMLRGKMRAEAANGETALVDAGQFLTLENSGKFVQNPLNKQGVAALEEWSGQKYEGPALAVADAKPAESKPADQSATSTPASSATPASGGAAQQPATEPATSESAAKAPEGGEEVAAAPGADSASAEGSEGGEEQKGEREKEKPYFEGGACMTQVGDQQWTLISLGVDLPIWKFGVFLDLEFWIDSKGQFSDKGWQFDSDTWYKSVLRKFRYVRFGHEGEPVFVKFGGLSTVSMGYGFVVDRFTNMLHYPDQKLLGLQLELNDLGAIGLTYQGLVADFYDIGNDGGVFANRLGFKFLKKTEIPILKNMLIAGTHAIDVNEFAPARDWDYTLQGTRWDRDEDGVTDAPYLQSTYGTWPLYDSLVAFQQQIDDYDSVVEDKDKWASREYSVFQAVAGDISFPIVSTKRLNLTIYGQAATRLDKVSGWGFGAPGVSMKVGPIWATLEYRHIDGQFEPGYFNTYYLDDRCVREPTPNVKSRMLPNVSLNGIFGRLGANIGDVFIISGDYQYLGAGTDDAKDQRFEATAKFGQKFVDKIPKLTVAEGFIYKTNIGEKNVFAGRDSTGAPTFSNDAFFEKTPYMYWGYRLGFEITKGASLIWQSRYGWKYNRQYKLKDDNVISITTAFTF